MARRRARRSVTRWQPVEESRPSPNVELRATHARGPQEDGAVFRGPLTLPGEGARRSGDRSAVVNGLLRITAEFRPRAEVAWRPERGAREVVGVAPSTWRWGR